MAPLTRRQARARAASGAAAEAATAPELTPRRDHRGAPPAEGAEGAAPSAPGGKGASGLLHALPALLQGSASLTVAIAAYCAGVYLVVVEPWYLNPMGYVVMGLAMTGLYDVAFGCTSLSPRRLFGSVEVSRVIGQAVLLLLLRPLQSLHVETLPEKGASLLRVWQRKMLGSLSFSTLNASAERNGLSHGRLRVAVQVAAVSLFAAVFFPAMVLHLGWGGLVRFWLVPFFFMHFQMGTFRPDLPLKEKQRLAYKFSPYGVLAAATAACYRTLAGGAAPAPPEASLAAAPTAVAAVAPALPAPQWEPVHWFNVGYLVAVHGGAAAGLSLLVSRGPAAMALPLAMAVVLYVVGCLGITAGVHRLWAHRSYEATLPMRILLMVFNSVANQGSILKWARDHRVHHKHVDTPKDPHNATYGFWWSHIGWLIWQKPKAVRDAGRHVHMEDLYADPVVVWQHRHYLPVSLTLCFGLPTAVGMRWGMGWECFMVAGLLRYCAALHATWCVNSVAHLWGYRPYLPGIMPAENWVVSLFAIGEGWHNYHHAYPYDYSTNEYGWLQLNVTTAFIDVCRALGLAHNCRRATPPGADAAAAPDPATLPSYSLAEVKALANQAACMLALDGGVYDLTSFEPLHPGGPKILKAYYGKDCTAAFRGGVHVHTAVADNMLKQYLVGTLAPDR